MKKISAASGVRNDLSPERFAETDLTAGTNIELDETGKTYRRLGVTSVAPGNMHSLFSAGQFSYVVKDGWLCLVDVNTPSFTQIIQVKGERVAYTPVNDRVFWSDGLQSGELLGAMNRRWGIQPPPAVVATEGYGNLESGTYVYTMTYVRADGTESGPAPWMFTRLGTGKGLSFTGLPISTDITVVGKRLYVSHCNGEVPLLAATLANSDTSCTYSGAGLLSIPVRGKACGAAPAGRVVGHYKGRTFVAENNYLWYSLPYEYGLFDLLRGYLGFSAPVTTFAAVSDGVYVGTESEIVFLSGDDPAAFELRPVADYGSILGTEEYVPNYYVTKEGLPELVPMWMSKHGVVVGLRGGEFKNLTGGHFILPEGVSAGASLLKVRGGTPQLITSLFD